MLTTRLCLRVCVLTALVSAAVPHRALGAETTPTPSPVPACNGDCNADHVVSIDELIQAVGYGLGSSPISRCPGFVCPDNPPIAIDCLLGAVNNALIGCPVPTPVPPMLSLGVQVSEFPDQQQTVIVAALRHLGGSAVSYLTGCTAQCDPPFLDPISFDVFGPTGDRVRVECEDGGPLYCPEWPQAFAAGDSLTQALTIEGVAWEGRDSQFPPCGGCKELSLPPGQYTVVARFTYGIGAGYPNPRFELTETVHFDWPPTGSPPTPTPPWSPLPRDTPSVIATYTATPTPTRPCPGTPGATCGRDSVFTCSDPPVCRCGCFTLTPTPPPTPTIPPCLGCEPDGSCTRTFEGVQYTGRCNGGVIIDGQCHGVCIPNDPCAENACAFHGECLVVWGGNLVHGMCANCRCLPIECGEVENVGGCCDFQGQRPCFPLVFGSDAARCLWTEHGSPQGCYGSVVCNESTGRCESQ